jgi:hypothetical protein
VDPRNVFPSPVSEGVVEMVSVLFTQVLRMRILGSSRSRSSQKFATREQRPSNPKYAVWGMCLAPVLATVVTMSS